MRMGDAAACAQARGPARARAAAPAEYFNTARRVVFRMIGLPKFRAALTAAIAADGVRAARSGRVLDKTAALSTKRRKSGVYREQPARRTAGPCLNGHGGRSTMGIGNSGATPWRRARWPIP